MNAQRPERSISRDLITLAAAVIFIIGMKLLADVIVPALFAIFLVFAFMPMLAWLQRKGLSRIWSVVVVIATVVVGSLGILVLVVISAAQIARNLTHYNDEYSSRINDLAQRLSDAGINVSGDSLNKQIEFNQIVSIAVRVLPPVISLIAGVAMALIIFVYLLIDKDGARRRLERGIGARDPQLARLSEVAATVGSYISIRAMLGGAAAILDFVLLLSLGVPYALFWAFVSFVMSFVPYIGYWVALIPPFLLALATLGWWQAAVVFFGYWAINGAIDNLVGPRMLGRGLNISPAVTVISLLFWGEILGPMGAILAMPLTVAVKLLLLERNPDSRWLSLLISSRSDDPALETPPEEP